MPRREKRMLESPLVPLGELPKMWDPVEGKVMSAEEMLQQKGAMVMSEKGSVRGKFRYFVVLGIPHGQAFSKEAFGDILKDDFFKTAVEVERNEITETHIILTLLIAPMLAPLDYVSDILGACKQKSIPLYNGFFIANGKKPSLREIQSYLRDFNLKKK